jgi:hypothetical protein
MGKPSRTGDANCRSAVTTAAAAPIVSERRKILRSTCRRTEGGFPVFLAATRIDATRTKLCRVLEDIICNHRNPCQRSNSPAVCTLVCAVTQEVKISCSLPEAVMCPPHLAHVDGLKTDFGGWGGGLEAEVVMFGVGEKRVRDQRVRILPAVLPFRH